MSWRVFPTIAELGFASITGTNENTANPVMVIAKDIAILKVINSTNVGLYLTLGGSTFDWVPSNFSTFIDLNGNQLVLPSQLPADAIGVYRDGAEPTSGKIFIQAWLTNSPPPE